MLTDDLAKRSNGLLKKIPEGQNSDYNCFNDAGVECETGEFLYGLCRLVRPLHVVETGTHIGVSAAYIGQALKDNQYGVLETVEYEKSHHDRAKKLFDALKLEQIHALNMSSEDFMPSHPVDILFLDTEPQIRFAELERFWGHVVPGGFILIHDLHSNMNQVENAEHGFGWPYGRISSEFKQLVRTGKLRAPIHFQTPRGLTLFYKPDEEAYRWR